MSAFEWRDGDPVDPRTGEMWTPADPWEFVRGESTFLPWAEVEQLLRERFGVWDESEIAELLLIAASYRTHP